MRYLHGYSNQLYLAYLRIWLKESQKGSQATNEQNKISRPESPEKIYNPIRYQRINNLLRHNVPHVINQREDNISIIFQKYTKPENNMYIYFVFDPTVYPEFKEKIGMEDYV